MQTHGNGRISGHVYSKQGKRGASWYLRARVPHEIRRRIGPAWTGKGRPPEGYFTRRTAEAFLHALLTDARRGTLSFAPRTGATFATAAEEWLRHARDERGVKPSTVREYRSALDAHLLPAFGHLPLERVTTAAIEAWRARLAAEGRLSRRTVDKLLTNLHGVLERARRAFGLPRNPVDDVERHPARYTTDLDFYSPEEVHALVRAAESEQDAAIFLTAAFTGLRRGELVALRWRDVDFDAATILVRASFTHGTLTTPKSGKVRSVPMVEEVAQTLARLCNRGRFTGSDDLVFPGVTGHHLDGSALRRRYCTAQTVAGLRPLRFHDLRHTFGSLAISRASVVQVQAWMGHADADTTHRYLHYKPRRDEAQLLAAAFAVEQPERPLLDLDSNGAGSDWIELRGR